MIYFDILTRRSKGLCPKSNFDHKGALLEIPPSLKYKLI